MPGPNVVEAEAAGRLVDLDEGDVSRELDYLSDELLIPDLGDFVHLRSSHPRRLDCRPGNPLDLALDWQWRTCSTVEIVGIIMFRSVRGSTRR
jgi:hypothetical protein